MPRAVLAFVRASLVVGIAALAVAQTATPDAETLREAARTGNLAAVKEALAAGVDVNATNDYGITALALACDHGYEDVVAALIEAGANVNAKDSFYHAAPIDWAIMRQRAAVLERLVKAGADGIDSALAAAVLTKDEALVKPLVECGRATPEGLRAALNSAREAKLESIVALLEAVAPKDPPSEDEEKEHEAASTAAWSVYAGTYQNDAGTRLHVSVGNEVLEVRGEDSDQSLSLTAAKDDQFVARGMEFTFVRDGDKITSLKLKVGDAEHVYTRKDENASLDPATAAAEPALEEPPAIALSPDFAFQGLHWPGFRGPMARGIADGQPLATTWNGPENQNIDWKCAIPGIGTSSPICWGNRVFVTTAVRESDTGGFRVGAYGDVDSVAVEGECQFLLLCLDLASGQVVWQREATRAVPQVKRHAKSSHANPTPATDGKYVVAFFGGEGVFCYDLEGNLKWTRQLGMLDSGWFYDRSYQWGFGSSPFIFENLVILQCDVQDGSFITALDLATGEPVWRTERDEIPTWSSPVAFETSDGQPTVVVCGSNCSAAYHARTGELLWRLGDFSEIVVPTPQITPDLVLLTSGYSPTQPMVALRHAARGELEMPEEKKAEAPFLWATRRGGPYLPTPLIYADKLYVLGNSGILNCHALGTGKRLYQQRVKSAEANAFTASPVAGNGHLYLTSETGVTFVVALDAEGTIVAQNTLGESVLATPAIAGGKLLIRGETNLYAIGAHPENIDAK